MDLLLAGGHVIDPASRKNGAFDIGITGNRISAVEPKLNRDNAKEVIDITGKTAVPGLIDLHTHVYCGGTSLGVDADGMALEAGVTTFVDAGSAGCGNFIGFKEHVIDRSRSRILAFLNISHAGIFGFDIGIGECADMNLINALPVVERAREFSDHIVGVKVRVGHYAGGTNGAMPLDIAKQASDKLAKPLMSHIDRPPPTIEDVLNRLGQGDILTHCFRPFPNQPVDTSGQVKNEVTAARERGVVFDTGHGRGSFGWESATKMLEQGFEPDVISSDVHTGCINGPAWNLMHVMSKFLALGMSLEKVIEKATAAPARAIDQTDIGHLAVGALADVTILHTEDGHFDFFDVTGECLTGNQKLVCDGLVVNGTVWS
jgi:dihydroorotase